MEIKRTACDELLAMTEMLLRVPPQLIDAITWAACGNAGAAIALLRVQRRFFQQTQEDFLTFLEAERLVYSLFCPHEAQALQKP